jgi:predicted glycoside hydrolase/deacetylase ChbG (UPF0249 family)
VLAIAAQPRLIVRGDDMGYSHSGNVAILKAHLEGIQSSIEVIVPSPWFPEAAEMLKKNPGADVGVHLALSSEWDNLKWRPLTAAPSLRDSNGYFYPMIWANKNYPGRALTDNKWKMAEVEAEFRAQIETAIKNLPGLTHISGHMGCTDLNDSVKVMVQRLAIEYKLIFEIASTGIKYVGYKGSSKTSAEKKKSFLAMLQSLEDGQTYMFVDHPGIDNEELRAIHHIGYENVATDRQGVTDTWTDPDVKELIRTRKIKLIGYKDLVN